MAVAAEPAPDTPAVPQRPRRRVRRVLVVVLIGVVVAAAVFLADSVRRHAGGSLDLGGETSIGGPGWPENTGVLWGNVLATNTGRWDIVVDQVSLHDPGLGLVVTRGPHVWGPEHWAVTGMAQLAAWALPKLPPGWDTLTRHPVAGYRLAPTKPVGDDGAEIVVEFAAPGAPPSLSAVSRCDTTSDHGTTSAR